MIRNWLDIIPADNRSITINEPLSFETEVIRNKIWYRGDAYELEQLYKQIGVGYGESSRFWAAVPETENIRKIHSGLPAMIVDTLAYIVKSDLNEVEFEDDEESKNKWNEISEKIGFDDLVGQAVRDALSSDDGAFKISVDTDVSPYPIVEFYPADRVDFLTKHGYVYGVDFWTKINSGKNEYRLRERYAKTKDQDGEKCACVSYALFEKGKEIPLSTVKELADLKTTVVSGDYLLAVPFVIYKNPRFPGRGKSIYDGKTGVFDAFDETISQWIDAVRAGRVQKYIPETMIPRNPINGDLGAVNSFGTNFVAVEGDDGSQSNDKIETIQPEIRYEAYLSTYMAMLDMCLQGIISPATLGIDVSKTASGEAQREKKDVTGYTRNIITDTLEKVLPQLVSAILMTYDNMHNLPAKAYNPTVSFGEYGAPDFNSRIESIGKAATASIMSIESQVDELWGASKDENWKKEEVLRIKKARGIEVVEEPPSVGGELIDLA